MATRMWRFIKATLAAGVYVITCGSLAYAHGGMASPEEIGPPLFTAAVLGMMCYMLMVTWPRSNEAERSADSKKRRLKRLPAHKRPIRLDSERSQLHLVKKVSNS